MTDKMNTRHVNASIFRGFCPSCRSRSLEHPKDLNYNGLICRNENCNWRNVYYVGPKSKMRGSSGSSSKSAILLDLTIKKRYKTGICHYCDHFKYPNGKIIDPSTDRGAKQMQDGTWKCGVCQLNDIKKVTMLLNRRQDI